ncbi:biotin-dependent carboxyltransferase family protein [Actinokineospora sp. PR83]|uniref:5-oxoprolinase subunit C family protein n=1 Tax=Actinokineospora sp. PR83 TaxID=2884908 RepID=UPI0027DF76F3|nr:biotin-dependent carboxyltransferase family protein [Actinokineospora sp. PR83]MCG8919569.1 biotin-dependent carboxyltransferase family protein [Actinokineospora sp. PR83]
MRRAVTVLAPGPSALVQDLGRPGYAHLGVPPSGALDAPSLRLANRLAGNAEGAAGIEVVLGGLVVRAEASCTVVVTGPSTPVLLAGRDVGSHAPVHLRAGDVVELGPPRAGLRSYLAVSGGLDVPPHLGSRSTDVLSGIGPDPLRAGDVLPLGTPVGPPTGEDAVAPPSPPDRLTVPVLLGPREDWFADPLAQLSTATWAVSPESNRVGLRLLGSPLVRAEARAERELTSEAVVTGAVQVPASGRPVIFLADHPTTGGYPVIGVVPTEHLAALAQARPGTKVRLRPRT